MGFIDTFGAESSNISAQSDLLKAADEAAAEAQRMAAVMTTVGRKLSEAAVKAQKARSEVWNLVDNVKARDLPDGTDAVVMVTNDSLNRKWLAWRAHDGSWDVTDSRGNASQMSGGELAALGQWVELTGKQD